MTRPCSNDLRERVARAHLTGGPDPVGGGAWRCERVLSAPISGALPGDRERGAGPDRRPPRVAAGSAARAGAHARGGGFGSRQGRRTRAWRCRKAPEAGQETRPSTRPVPQHRTGSHRTCSMPLATGEATAGLPGASASSPTSSNGTEQTLGVQFRTLPKRIPETPSTCICAGTFACPYARTRPCCHSSWEELDVYSLHHKPRHEPTLMLHTEHPGPPLARIHDLDV